jgi:LPXTG-motif cell wall-anchored protein
MKRSTSLLLTGAFGLGSAAILSIAAPGVASASCAGPITVTEDDSKGWLIPDSGNTNGGTATFDSRAELNLVLNAGTNNVRISYPTATAVGEGIPLADMTDQSNYEYDFQRYEGGPSESGAPTYQLTLDTNGTEAGGFATLVYEPVYQGATHGTWWSTRPNPGTGPAPIHHEGGHGSDDWGTLAEFSQAYPKAVIQAFGINQAVDPNGPSGDSGISSLDQVKFGCNIFNFDGGETPPPAANQAPLPTFSAETSNLTVNVDATDSTDPDGVIVSYSWNWGDGSPAGSGETATHAYANPGEYTITLTVTDDDGATGTVSKSIGVSRPANDGVANGPLPNTGADVMGLAALGAVVLVGGGAGVIITNRRRSSISAA